MHVHGTYSFLTLLNGAWSTINKATCPHCAYIAAAARQLVPPLVCAMSQI